jgi:WD40 repeat protein
VWSLEDKLLVHTLRSHRGEIYALEFSSDGNTMLSASGDRTVRLWDATLLNADSSDAMESSCRVLTVNDTPQPSVAFTSVSISQDSRFVAAGSLDSAIRVWDLTAVPEDSMELEGAKLVDKLSGHENSVYSVKFVHGLSAKGEALVSGSMDKTLKRLDVGPFDEDGGVRGASPELEGHGENGSNCVKTLRGHKVREFLHIRFVGGIKPVHCQDFVLATSVVREGLSYRVASASKDGSVRMWDLRTGMVQFLIQGHKNTGTAGFPECISRS